MGHARSAIAGAAFSVVWLAGAAVCGRAGHAAGRDRTAAMASVAGGPAPATDFLVAAGDSTFWVTTGARGVRLRGSPLILARFGGRFYELYVTDDDRSYYDAVFTGQRVYRRDLERGDSVAVVEDTAVAGAARMYAATHPHDTPLDSDEDVADSPSMSVTSDVDILNAYGAYLSFEYHGARAGRAAPESGGGSGEQVRRGVVDLRSGRGATVAEIFGARGGDSVLALGRRAYAAALDSVHVREAQSDDRARLAGKSLVDFAFDPTSFFLTDVDREPAVAFFVPGRGAQGGRSLGLPAMRAPAPDWWVEERALLPAAGRGADSAADVWPHPPNVLVAHYDSAGMARLVLVDATRREWPIGRLPTPVRRVYWLDGPTFDPAMRRALVRAFDESALYSDDARAASRRVRSAPPLVHLAGATTRRPQHRRSGRRTLRRAPAHRALHTPRR
jgi:hypothetical protein